MEQKPGSGLLSEIFFKFPYSSRLPLTKFFFASKLEKYQKKAVKKRSTDDPPSERITRRLRGDFGMDIWKVASEPECERKR